MPKYNAFTGNILFAAQLKKILEESRQNGKNHILCYDTIIYKYKEAKMQTIGIRELQTNPAIFTKTLENNELAIITKRSAPIGIAVAFNDSIVSNGLKTSLLLEAFKNGMLSLGQFCKAQNISKKEGMRLLSIMGIDMIDYSFADDLETLKGL